LHHYPHVDDFKCLFTDLEIICQGTICKSPKGNIRKKNTGEKKKPEELYVVVDPCVDLISSLLKEAIY